jgi:hypothetical protein
MGLHGRCESPTRRYVCEPAAVSYPCTVELLKFYDCNFRDACEWGLPYTYESVQDGASGVTFALPDKVIRPMEERVRIRETAESIEAGFIPSVELVK